MGVPVEEYVTRRPHPSLAGLVARYQGYRQHGVAPALQRGLPSPYLTFVVALDDAVLVDRHPTPDQPADRYEVLVGGLHLSPATVRHEGRQSGIQVSLHPAAASALLGVPGGALAHLDLHGDEVLGGLAPELRERAGQARSWDARVAAVDAVLVRRAAAMRDRPAGRAGALDVERTVARAWRLLVERGGRIGVGELAAEVGWGERRLRDQMQRHAGLTPKSAARVIRFDRARRVLAARVAAGDRPDLAGIAAATGYADQSHLDRDWAGFTGISPLAWVREEVRNIQARARTGVDP